MKTNLPWLNSQAPFELLWMDFLRSRAAYVRTHLDTLAAFAPKRCPSSAFIREPSPTAMTRDRFAPIVKPGAPYRPKRLRRSRPHAPVSYETLSGLRGTWRTKLHLHELASRRSHIVGVTRALRTRASAVWGRERRRRGRRRQGIETSRTSRGSIEDPGAIGPFASVAGEALAEAINCLSRATGESTERTKEIQMFLTLFVVLLVMWLLGFFAFHVAGGLIHLLLIVAVIALVVHLFRGRSMA
ncbi:MAG: lmo0937 family membrane protein [Bryobacteraceae bacterium]